MLNKKFLFGFILGALIFGTTGVIAATILANNVSYDDTSSGLNVNNVQDAIDALNTKANNRYDEYDGATTYTPNSNTQTILTNNKLMKSDITINPVPSSYKNLSTTTTALASDIVSGKTAYNNSGTLITGTNDKKYNESEYTAYGNTRYNAGLAANESAISSTYGYKYGTYTCSGADEKKWFDVGFKPRYVIISLENVDGTRNAAVLSYKQNVSTTKSYRTNVNDASTVTITMEGKNGTISSLETHIYGVDNTGFGFYFRVADRTIYWVAVR